MFHRGIRLLNKIVFTTFDFENFTMPMTLSVVIVNYNVKYFLEQCLISVLKAMKGINGEVFVVDNASVDGSCQMVKERFPNVRLIENSQNHGFSFANNQALRVVSGEYVLVLNPDTVVEEGTFSKCLQFMDKHPDAGGLSVKMIDGKGKFLPESKRALPSPMVSFYKIFGFAKLFPHSKKFGRYHLGHLNENQTHEIEILPGAFMFIRKRALDKAGLFDETFFMYGEDIDLSYRIILNGFKNYYFPETTIIHYKGESTKKGSINYVMVFYKAMIIFARKHFSQKNALVYSTLIYIAIYFRAAFSIGKRIFNRYIEPLVDALIIALGIAIIIPFWETFRFSATNIYPDKLVMLLSAVYIVIWLISIWLSGGYDKPRKKLAAAKGAAVGSIVILLLYALLPEGMRFSRAVILLLSAWTIGLIQLTHWGYALIRKEPREDTNKPKRIVIVGKHNEALRVENIMKQASVRRQLMGIVLPENDIAMSNYLGSLSQLDEVVRVNEIDEVIYCSSDVSSQNIIKSMLTLMPLGVDFKIAPPESLSVIGSNSIDTAGDLYTVDINAISLPSNKRFKRIFDIAISLVLILLLPILVFFGNGIITMLQNSLHVLVGKRTWIGYIGKNIKGLPAIKQGVYPPIKLSNIKKKSDTQVEKINMLYAKNYSVLKDVEAIWTNINQTTR